MTTRRWIVPLCAAVAAGAAWWLLRSPAPRETASLDAGIEAACARCHAFPAPGILPRSAWRTQIEHMASLGDLLPGETDARDAGPPLEEIVAWYEARAPEQLALQRALTRDEAPPLRFRRRSVRLGAGSGPGVASVRRLDAALAPEDGPVLVTANMATGNVHLVSARGGPHRVAEAGHPARVAPGDLDGDGRLDLVIADLGDAMPNEAPVGRVLAALAEGEGRFALRTLVRGIGRVADVGVLDLDGDGDLDVVAAAFGFLRRGGVYVLRNQGAAEGALDFRVERVSDRVGAVSVVPFDEGPPAGPRRGFAVAFSQHYEWVSAFVPERDGYRERVLHRAPHPAWGTSHLAPVDLDGDGDTDFLLSNGDTLDDGVAFKPYHGVHWLENRGDAGFTAHRIGGLYGAHGAEAADLDGDGDLDVVAVGFLPQVELPVPTGGMRVDSVIWFERTGEGWIPWSIEADHPRHTGLAIVDFDGDGRLDVVAAINRAWDVRGVEIGPSLEIWFNEGAAPGRADRR